MHLTTAVALLPDSLVCIRCSLSAWQSFCSMLLD